MYWLQLGDLLLIFQMTLHSFCVWGGRERERLTCNVFDALFSNVIYLSYLFQLNDLVLVCSLYLFLLLPHLMAQFITLPVALINLKKLSLTTLTAILNRSHNLNNSCPPIVAACIM